MDGGAWWAPVHGITESDTTEGRSAHTHGFSACLSTCPKSVLLIQWLPLIATSPKRKSYWLWHVRAPMCQHLLSILGDSPDLCVCVCLDLLYSHSCSFSFFNLFFLLKDNCFTEFCCFLLKPQHESGIGIHIYPNVQLRLAILVSSFNPVLYFSQICLHISNICMIIFSYIYVLVYLIGV